MKFLRIFLAAVYAVLILLILLLASTCRHNPVPEPENEIEDEDTVAVEVEPADTTDIGRAEDVGGHGRLKITLLWDFPGDIDLHVMEPNHNEIFFDSKIDQATGGELDYDDQHGGRGAAENVTWSTPPAGDYQVALVYFKVQPAGSEPIPGKCRVLIFNGDHDPETYEVQLDGTLQQPVFVTTVHVDETHRNNP